MVRVKCLTLAWVGALLFFVLFCGAGSAVAQHERRSFDALVGYWAVEKNACSPGAWLQVTKKSINLFDETQCSIEKTMHIGQREADAWLVKLRCGTVDLPGSSLGQQILILDASVDELYSYERNYMNKYIRCK